MPSAWHKNELLIKRKVMKTKKIINKFSTKMKFFLPILLVAACGFIIACGNDNDLDTYTISFYNNGGIGTLDPIEVKFGEPMPDISAELAPEKLGYYFAG